METKSGIWWTKNSVTPKKHTENSPELSNEDFLLTNTLLGLTGRDKNLEDNVDVGSIIEEINRVVAQSPIGPYEINLEGRSVDELMREAEKIYLESSKSFEQLSQRSGTSQNISEIRSSVEATPTPKSLSPLPLDKFDTSSSMTHNFERDNSNDTYSDVFSLESKVESSPFSKDEVVFDEKVKEVLPDNLNQKNEDNINLIDLNVDQNSNSASDLKNLKKGENKENFPSKILLDVEMRKNDILDRQMILKDRLIKSLEDDNKKMKNEIDDLVNELQDTKSKLTRSKVQAMVTSPSLQLELHRALEDLKDVKELNTGLQLQLDQLNQNHARLRKSYDDLLVSSKNHEKNATEFETALEKHKDELANLHKDREKLLENQVTLNKLLDVEKLKTKSLKVQTETDAKCIQDLNRQIKEMERIITRKHPDSVSALIFASKSDPTDKNLSARKLLEDRIKVLEQEALSKEQQSSKIFLDIQDKFNQMKLKYESHIEDLELHVSDLKSQMKRSCDTFDIYTQTITDDVPQGVPQKESVNTSTQTMTLPSSSQPPKVIAVKRNEKLTEARNETHLLATIRGMQSDLNLKDRAMLKLQKEMVEVQKTNRRLQMERETSLRNTHNKREFRSYPEKLSAKLKSPVDLTEEVVKDDSANNDRLEFEKLRAQLYRIEEDYQNLKQKRMHDLNALQEAHEQELASYMTSLNPLREQLELQHITIATLQSQLQSIKEELTVVAAERDHLNEKVRSYSNLAICNGEQSVDSNIESLQNKIMYLEKRYEEREHRIRAIVNGLAQKNTTNRNCDQCAERQKQLISYKIELDQILASLRALQ